MNSLESSALGLERISLREAVFEAVGDSPVEFREVVAVVREHWGSASRMRIRARLDELVRDGALRHDDLGYVRVERDDDEDEDATLTLGGTP